MARLSHRVTHMTGYKTYECWALDRDLYEKTPGYVLIQTLNGWPCLDTIITRWFMETGDRENGAHSDPWSKPRSDHCTEAAICAGEVLGTFARASVDRPAP